jgi:hypothetical protein
MIFLSLYVFLRFLTWRARHSQPLFATRRFFFVISEPLQLVIRRVVEIESLQLNLWTLGLVWFIVTFHDVPFQ